MIPISKINSNFDIFNENKVVIWGAGYWGRELLFLLRSVSIEVDVFCDMDSKKWGSFYHDVPVLSPTQLKEEKSKDDIIVQLAVDGKNEEIITMLQEIGIDHYISQEETLCIVPYIQRITRIKKLGYDLISAEESDQTRRNILKKELLNTIHLYEGKEIILTCAIGKTGNNTLNDTLKHHHLPYFFSVHRPSSCFTKYLQTANTKIKVVTGVRDPMAQIFSSIFNVITAPLYVSQECNLSLSQIEPHFFHDGGNIQVLFDHWLQVSYEKNQGFSSPVTRFFQEYREEFFDIFAEDFQKEKGYTILKKGNIEIFLYQLEKMNDILPAFSAFVGCEIPSWVKANAVEEKWIGEKYPQALKELNFTKDFLHKVYKEDWVHHFYSEKDLQTFKNKWEKNII